MSVVPVEDPLVVPVPVELPVALVVSVVPLVLEPVLPVVEPLPDVVPDVLLVPLGVEVVPVVPVSELPRVRSRLQPTRPMAKVKSARAVVAPNLAVFVFMMDGG